MRSPWQRLRGAAALAVALAIPASAAFAAQAEAATDPAAAESAPSVLLLGLDEPVQQRAAELLLPMLREHHPGATVQVLSPGTTLLAAYYRERPSALERNDWLDRLHAGAWDHVVISPTAYHLQDWLPELCFEGLRLTTDFLRERRPDRTLWLAEPRRWPDLGLMEQQQRADLQRITHGLGLERLPTAAPLGAAGLEQEERAYRYAALVYSAVRYRGSETAAALPEGMPPARKAEHDRACWEAFRNRCRPAPPEGAFVGYVTPLELRGELTGLAFGTSTMQRAIRQRLPALFEADRKNELELRALQGSMTENLRRKPVRDGLAKQRVDFCWAQDKGEDFAPVLLDLREQLGQDGAFLYFLRYADAPTLDNTHDIGPMMVMEGQQARALACKAVPLRAAWGRMWERYPELPMMDANLKHAATPVMEMIAAMTYAMLTGLDPRELQRGDPSPAAVIAAETVHELGRLERAPGSLAPAPLPWRTDLDESLRRAGIDGRPLLLFVSDGGRSAEATEAALEDPANRARLQGLVLVRHALGPDDPLGERLRLKSGAALLVLDPAASDPAAGPAPDPLADPAAKLVGKRDAKAVTRFLDKARKKLD